MAGEVAERLWLILLLGSYDTKTKEVLNRVKREIAKYSTYIPEHMIPLLLEDVELYKCWHPPGTDIIVEKFNSRATVMVLEHGGLTDIWDIDAETLEDIDDELRRIGYEYIRPPVMEKLGLLAKLSFLLFILRHRELTRGGEYIELAFLLSRGLDPSKVYLLIRHGIEISTMVEELIDTYKMNVRFYRGGDRLGEMVRRIIYHELERAK
jgi:hypothetical protein